VRWLPAEFKERNGAIPWTQIAGLRNRIVHDYFGLDLKVIWQVIPDFVAGAQTKARADRRLIYSRVTTGKADA